MHLSEMCNRKLKKKQCLQKKYLYKFFFSNFEKLAMISRGREYDRMEPKF